MDWIHNTYSDNILSIHRFLRFVNAQKRFLMCVFGWAGRRRTVVFVDWSCRGRSVGCVIVCETKNPFYGGPRGPRKFLKKKFIPLNFARGAQTPHLVEKD